MSETLDEVVDRISGMDDLDATQMNLHEAVEDARMLARRHKLLNDPTPITAPWMNIIERANPLFWDKMPFFARRNLNNGAVELFISGFSLSGKSDMAFTTRGQVRKLADLLGVPFVE